jgi:Nucleotidyl transferase AbiEii toxin, Type IV TA system
MKNAHNFSDIRRIAITAVFSDDYLFERVVLKGGNALAIALGMSDRTSLDLDFSIENDFDDLSEAERRLRAALENRFRTAGFVVFDFTFSAKPSTPHAGQSPRWGGYVARFKLMPATRYAELEHDLQAMRRESTVIGRAEQRKFEIDLSKFEYTRGKLSAELDHYQIYVYAPEMIAIEKLRAICQQMPAFSQNRTPGARARDFYDIHLVVTKGQINLASKDNLDLLRNIFAAKDVPIALLQSIAAHREMHRPDWDNVLISLTREDKPNEFDFYFDFVLEQVALLHALWDE